MSMAYANPLRGVHEGTGDHGLPPAFCGIATHALPENAQTGPGPVQFRTPFKGA
jgi:hypothetical protein